MPLSAAEWADELNNVFLAPDEGVDAFAGWVRITMSTMEYRNLASRMLLTRQWENQHIVPLEQPKSRVAMMRFLSRTVLRPRAEGIEIKAPIFILGTPRCGSTMLQELMACHDATAYFTHSMDVFPDPDLFRAVDWTRRHLGLDVRGERYLKDSIIVDGSSPSEAMRFWGECLNLDPFQLQWPERRVADLTQEQVQRIYTTVRHVLACFRERGSTRFMNKSPALLTEALLLQDLFPDARFVHLVRDGRMVANSLLKLYHLQRQQDIKVDHPLFKERPFVPYPRVPGLAEAAARFGLEDIRTTAAVWDSAVRLVAAMRPRLKHFYEVRYEDILADPRQEMRRIFEFCELPTIGSGAAAYEERLSKVGVIHHKNSYGDFDLVESIAKDGLRRHGYLQ